MGDGVDQDSETIKDTGGTKLMTRINGKASENGQGPAGAAKAIYYYYYYYYYCDNDVLLSVQVPRTYPYLSCEIMDHALFPNDSKHHSVYSMKLLFRCTLYGHLQHL